MKRIYSVEELVEFERKVEEQYLEDDVDEFIRNFRGEAEMLWCKNNIEVMMVFEEGELEDEEYGLAATEDNPEVFRMVYMSCRCNDCRLMLASLD